MLSSLYTSLFLSVDKKYICGCVLGDFGVLGLVVDPRAHDALPS